MNSLNHQDQQIIERFSGFDPATLYEAAGLQGMIDPEIRATWPGAKILGIAATVKCPPSDNLMLHIAVARAAPGTVIVADAGGYMNTGAWGEVLTTAAQARGITGLVINGVVRDIEEIEALNFPVFSRGLAIGSCTKRVLDKLDESIQIGGAIVRSGDIIVGNADGLVVICKERADEVLEAAINRRKKEAEIMKELRKGKTTIELLNLSDYEVE